MSSDHKDQTILEEHSPNAPFHGGVLLVPDPRSRRRPVESADLRTPRLRVRTGPPRPLVRGDRPARHRMGQERHRSEAIPEEPFYAGLSRGRVTRPGGYLILHGDDAPIAGWLTIVIRSFRLEGFRYRVVVR